MNGPATLKKKAYNRRFMRERRAKMDAAYLCRDCGVKPVGANKVDPSLLGKRCDECAARHARLIGQDKNRKRPAWQALGICVLCGHREAMKKETRCAVCAERQDEYRAAHPWRKAS